MPGLSYFEKNGKEVQTYHYNAELGLTDFPFVFDTLDEGTPVPGPGDRTQAMLINCSSLSPGRTRSVRIQAVAATLSVLNLWSAETKEEIEEAVASGDPAQLLMYDGGIDIILPVTSSWLAFDYDAALSGTIDPATFKMSITIT
jgi:hypothetical protein